MPNITEFLNLTFAGIFDLAPWMQFGLAGVCFITLAYMVFKKSDVVDKLLALIEKRDEKFVDLQEKTLNTLGRNSTALEKVVLRLKNIEEILKDEEE